MLGSLGEDPFGGGVWRRLSGTYPRCGNAAALALSCATGSRRARGKEQHALEQVVQLLEKKAAALQRLRGYIRRRGLARSLAVRAHPADLRADRRAARAHHQRLLLLVGGGSGWPSSCGASAAAPKGARSSAPRGSTTTLLKVGRDPDSDIRLNDLAVALHHATLEQVSATRIGVSAEMGMTRRDRRPHHPGRPDRPRHRRHDQDRPVPAAHPRRRKWARRTSRSTSSAPTRTRTTTSSTPAASRCRA